MPTVPIGVFAYKLHINAPALMHFWKVCMVNNGNRLSQSLTLNHSRQHKEHTFHDINPSILLDLVGWCGAMDTCI